MSWEAISIPTYTPSVLENSRLFPEVDYPRQPGFSEPDMSHSVRIQVESDSVTPHRRTRELDLSGWDDDAAARLRSMARPPGDWCDFLATCRRPLGLRRPPQRRFLSPQQLRTYRKPLGVIWFVRDACGIICIAFTWCLILYAEFVISCVILPRFPSTIFSWCAGLLYHLFASLAVISHMKAFSTDPGTIPIGNATTDAIVFLNEVYGDAHPPIIRCPKCLCIKPLRTHHCRICYRCVRKMDHHCPWINNCVGEGNQKYFVLFTLYTCLQSFFAIFVCIHFVIRCVDSDWEMCQLDPASTTFSSYFALQLSPFASCAFILGLVMEALVFGLFTMVMCMTQVHSIAYDETGIESLTKDTSKTERRSRCKNMAISCGSPLSWRWFNPFSPPPPVTPVFSGLSGDGDDFLPPDCYVPSMSTATNLSENVYLTNCNSYTSGPLAETSQTYMNGSWKSVHTLPMQVAEMSGVNVVSARQPTMSL
ncbi:hypothetical protein P879_04384 [Paragonimus westermani]|uniref:Palmitoyltransferase n=1 Tax=Paragonimus westermani TaxID=34504 RepID=A0A8T0DL43_9TREM|nr:hypothetical protein P879_04384 [Paragonimus westermani]